jgi:hypothetical protein
MDAIRTVIIHAINRDGFDNLSGETFLAAMEDLGVVSAGGLYELNVANGNRAPNRTQIRQAQLENGSVVFQAVTDWYELPDTRPAAQ